jgi:hypothetical protein
MMEMFVSMAISEFNNPLNMAIPCSVNAKGAYRGPPQLEVLNLHLKFCHSASLNSNIKSEGFASLKLRESKKSLDVSPNGLFQCACFHLIHFCQFKIKNDLLSCFREALSEALAKIHSEAKPRISRMLFLMCSSSMGDLFYDTPNAMELNILDDILPNSAAPKSLNQIYRLCN